MAVRPESIASSQTYPITPGFKAPGTSEYAANTTDAVTLRELAYQSLRKSDKTADEVAADLGIDRLAIRPRITELVRLGRVRKTEITRRNASGKPATVWRAVQDFHEQQPVSITQEPRNGMGKQNTLFPLTKDASSL